MTQQSQTQSEALEPILQAIAKSGKVEAMDLHHIAQIFTPTENTALMAALERLRAYLHKIPDAVTTLDEAIAALSTPAARMLAGEGEVARQITDHPCHGLFVSAGDRLTHRHWFLDGSLMATCERCGTLIDREHKEVGPVSWKPEKRNEVVSLNDRYRISAAAMKALGEWLAWPDAGRDGPREVTVEQTISFLRGLPNKLGYAHPPAAEPVGLREALETISRLSCPPGNVWTGAEPSWQHEIFRISNEACDNDATPARTDDAGVGGDRERVARIIAPSAWKRREEFQATMRGEGRIPPEPEKQTIYLRSATRRVDTVVAPSLEMADRILAALKPADTTPAGEAVQMAVPRGEWYGYDRYIDGKFEAGYLLDRDQEPELREVAKFNCRGLAEPIGRAIAALQSGEGKA